MPENKCELGLRAVKEIIKERLPCVPHGISVPAGLPPETARTPRFAQSVGFQNDSRIKNVLCNNLFFRDLQKRKKGLM